MPGHADEEDEVVSAGDDMEGSEDEEETDTPDRSVSGTSSSCDQQSSPVPWSSPLL